MWADQVAAGSSSCDEQLDDSHDKAGWQSSKAKKRRIRSGLNQGEAGKLVDVSDGQQSVQPVITQPRITEQNVEQNVNANTSSVSTNLCSCGGWSFR